MIELRHNLKNRIFVKSINIINNLSRYGRRLAKSLTFLVFYIFFLPTKLNKANMRKIHSFICIQYVEHRKSQIKEYLDYCHTLEITVTKNLSARNYFFYKYLAYFLQLNGLFLFSYSIRISIKKFLSSDINRYFLPFRQEKILIDLENLKFRTRFEAINRVLSIEQNIKKQIKNYKPNILQSDLTLDGKNIAVIGPINININENNNLLENNLFIRTKYNYRLHKNYIVEKKTNISYYQTETLDENLLDSIEHLDSIVLTNKKLNMIINSKFNYKSRLISFKDFPLHFGYPNHLNKVLFDLLSVSTYTSRIKIYGFNFYLGPNLYFKDYREGAIENSDEYNLKTLQRFWVTQTFHNIGANFELTKNLYFSGLIDASADICNILGLSEYDYMKKIDSIYGFSRN